VLQRTDLEVMAMGTLASGYLTPDEAFAYVRTLPAVKSLVVGASSREHIAETFDAVARKF
jgi:aryl-alcohol dehydrogenase-like predicted oxidoreductase